MDEGGPTFNGLVLLHPCEGPLNLLDHVRGRLRVAALPPLHLAPDVALGLAHLAQPRRLHVDAVQRHERVDEGAGDAGHRVRVGRIVRRPAEDDAGDVLHHVERGAEHAVRRLVGERLGDRHALG